MTETPACYYGRDLEAMSKAINYNNWIISEFNSSLGKITAEIGAGCGNFTESLLKNGVEQILACEPSANMFSLLKNRFENDERVVPANSCLNAETIKKFNKDFDSIMYVNVLEHIEDDEKELKLAYEIMKPGSKLLIFAPAMPSLMSSYDRAIGHFRRYRRSELNKKVTRAGFNVLKCRYFDYLGVFAWFLSMRVLKCDLHKTNVSLYDKFLVPVLKPIEKYVQMPFGKSLLLIAER